MNARQSRKESRQVLRIMNEGLRLKHFTIMYKKDTPITKIIKAAEGLDLLVQTETQPSLSICLLDIEFKMIDERYSTLSFDEYIKKLNSKRK